MTIDPNKLARDIADIIEGPHAWAAREAHRIGAEMNAKDPCTCGHGEPMHRASRRTYEGAPPDGHCCGYNCKCIAYQKAAL